ncbi:hypothetical protein ALP05_00679 [Pseudomonas caricapapayae]|uniref:Uncharacterized protein n=1 Tax=Pseudomonas caricapapayae TaxID=46678 RepID=A0A3M6F8Y7_9PSED|nr:hypothetical protein [Pseudomonas caricapapayae]RMV76456.1 hypothetical protein ALP05_00679 [Pseudomonas caricapapayae]
MKIKKLALSILAVAISSSAFAATTPDTDFDQISLDAYVNGMHSLKGESQESTASQSVLVTHTNELSDDGADQKNVEYNLSLEESLTPVNSRMRDGFVKFSSEYKDSENAKAITEFNTLQDLAFKESEPAVKALIKQAADLKLASYSK